MIPSGKVKTYSIDEICEISRGRVISKDYIKDNSGLYPVYSSQTENNGELGRIDTFDYEGEYLTWTTDGANAGSIFYRNGKFNITNVCGLLRIKDSYDILPQYLLYKLGLEAPKHVSAGMGNPKLMSNTMARIKVEIPTLEVQKIIVDQLSAFRQLIESLEDEQKARVSQYLYCASALFEGAKKEATSYMISEICNIEKGKTPIQKAVPGEYPMVVTTSERRTCDSYQFELPAVCIPLVSSRGHGVASLNHVYYQEGKFALGNILCALTPKEKSMLCAKYLYYYFEMTKDYTLVPLMKGGANVSLRIDDIEKIRIPVPSFEQQEHIVSSLSVLESLCYSNTDGIPAEIEARKQQYHYYREELLTFEEK